MSLLLSPMGIATLISLSATSTSSFHGCIITVMATVLLQAYKMLACVWVSSFSAGHGKLQLYILSNLCLFIYLFIKFMTLSPEWYLRSLTSHKIHLIKYYKKYNNFKK